MKSVRYDRFTGGEFGTTGPVKAPRGTFTARNMQLYDNGSLGVRAGTVALAYTGVSVGAVLGFGWRGTPGVDLWYIQGTTIYYAGSGDIGDAVTAFTGSLGATPTTPVQGVEYGVGSTLITSYGDASYEINHIGLTVTELTGSPGGEALCFFNDVLYIIGDNTQANRVNYSEIANINSWPAPNFFDVGNESGAVKAAWTQRNHVSIATQNGEWWVQTGVPPGQIRRVSGGGVHPWVFGPDAGAILGSDALMHVPIGSDYPAIFDGTQPQESRNVEINNGIHPLNSGDVKVLRGVKPEEAVILFPSGKRAGLQRNGVWTIMDLGPEFTSYAASDQQGQIMLSTEGDGGTAPEFHTWKIDLDRPGITSDLLSSPVDSGDAATDPQVEGYLYFPEEWMPTGKEVRVRSVIVDFDYWDTGAVDLNEIEVQVRALAIEGVDEPADSVAQSWTRDGSGGPNASPFRKRAVFRMGADHFGAAFQIRFTKLRGVAIHSVVAWYDERDVPVV